MSNEFVITRRVQFVETDLAGVLHFSNYYRYMEEVECAFWRAQGLGVIHKDNDVEISWPRVATKCEYRAPARFEQELEVALTVAHVGGRSVTYNIEFRRDGKRIAAGSTTAVCCADGEDGFRPVAIPQVLRTILLERVTMNFSHLYLLSPFYRIAQQASNSRRGSICLTRFVSQRAPS